MATETPAAGPAQEWISALRASRMLGVNVYNIHKLAITGRIATRAGHGERVKYSARDVERILAERLAESAEPA